MALVMKSVMLDLGQLGWMEKYGKKRRISRSEMLRVGVDLFKREVEAGRDPAHVNTDQHEKGG